MRIKHKGTHDEHGEQRFEMFAIEGHEGVAKVHIRVSRSANPNDVMREACEKMADQLTELAARARELGVRASLRSPLRR